MKLSLITILLILLMSSSAFAFDDGDFQYWNTESLSWKINDKWKASLTEELRLGDDGGNLYWHHTDIGFSYSGVADWLDLAIHYLHAFEDKNSKWKRESRPHVNATVKWKWLDANFSNRLRFEYRDREDADDFWRLRNNIGFKWPSTFTKLEIRPYVNNDIFYDFDAEKLNQNRLYSGFNMKLIKDLTLDIYYLWKKSKSGDKWIDSHVLGSKLKLSF